MHTFKVLEGVNRTAKIWKPTEYTLKSIFDKRFNTPIKIPMTVEEFAKASKETKDEYKNVVAFIGAKSKTGNRKVGDIEYRTLITLDIDHGDIHTLSKVKAALINYSYIIHPTASSTVSQPRYRLIIPPNNIINNDQYEPLCRRIMYEIGIDYFDTTCVEINRLFFYPAIPEGGTYKAEYNEGLLLNVDEWLNKYNDWKNVDEWCFSWKEKAMIHNQIHQKQQDPSTKTGFIGAFCRVYDIHSAIAEFIPKSYEEGTMLNRYNFVNENNIVTSINGLEVYNDGIFAYSFQESDPCSRTLNNAFDLIRKHLFPDEDEKKSLKKMLEFCKNIDDVKSELVRHDFDIRQQKEIDNLNESDISRKLRTSGKGGKLLNSFYNFCILAENYLQKSVKFNEFTGEIDVVSDLPWRKKRNSLSVDVFDIQDVLNLRFKIDTDWEIDAKEKLQDSFLYQAGKQTYHPVKEYLESLQWDGIKRANRLFIDFLQAEDNEYTQTITHVMLTGAVKRIYNPGCKFDFAMVLQGHQGCRKSLLLSLLAKDWGSDAFNKNAVDDVKETAEQTKGVWIAEIPEMAAFNKKEVEHIKNLITRVSDKCRLAYAQTSSRNLRTTIFAITTNDAAPFRDETGNRRFPLIKVSKDPRSDEEWSNTLNIDQIWAEVVYWYNNGDTKTTVSKNIVDTIEDIANEHMEVDPWFDRIQHYVDKGMVENYWDTEEEDSFNTNKTVKRIPWDALYTDDVWENCLKRKIGDLKTPERKRLVNIFKQLGFDKKIRIRTRLYGQIRVLIKDE